ncbi:MAG: MBL fold metallo-hydrolase [Spirochaetes bacterium]|uniref:MBL fold metallo-hydrolase n=1 Tax=Candidatus Ornithospirochaeta stercoripullorum TaxID=2840899 RepID=A0A9D9H582_9SPIO|nr:MBL fold metallo-hydrolase [Candidatus Ornithospirochaeta stercoripullorum]
MIRQSVFKIADSTWCINEFNLVNAFLVEGEESAAIIDTGCGLGNIRKVVEGFVQKPLSVFLTHSHPDHTGGIYHFTDCPIYMNKDDANTEIFGFKRDNEFRRNYVLSRGPVRNPEHVSEMLSLIPSSQPDCTFSFVDIDDGTVLSLGGREFECIHTPGHTEGSICFLDASRRILFSGDTVNNSIILPRQKDNNTSLIEKYHNTLQKLWQRESQFDVLAIGHESATVGKDLIHDYLCLSEGLLNGSIRGAYEEKGFRKGDVARLGKAELWYQCDT